MKCKDSISLSLVQQLLWRLTYTVEYGNDSWVTKYVSPPHITRGTEEIHLSPFFQLSFPAEREREEKVRAGRCMCICCVGVAWNSQSGRSRPKDHPSCDRTHERDTFGKEKKVGLNSTVCIICGRRERRNPITFAGPPPLQHLLIWIFLQKGTTHTEWNHRKEKKKKKGIDDGDWQVCVWQRQGNNELHTGTSSRILTNNQRPFSSLAFLWCYDAKLENVFSILFPIVYRYYIHPSPTVCTYIHYRHADG